MNLPRHLVGFIRTIGVGLLLLATSCARTDSPPKLELNLTLARRHWYVGESPWYLLQVRNVGDTPATLIDPAWFDQHYLLSDSRTKSHTRFRITGPKGQGVRPPRSLWGIHGERDFWRNDCGGGKPCDRVWIDLKPGESFAAMPSIEKPVREASNGTDAFDLRALPYTPPNIPPAKLEALKKDWKATVNSIWGMGNPRLKLDTAKALREIPKGYRILELYDFDKPGIYRLQVIYDDICRFQDPPHPELARRPGEPKEPSRPQDWGRATDAACKKALRVESNIVEIEVHEPPPSQKGPATKLRNRTGETDSDLDRALKEIERSTAR